MPQNTVELLSHEAARGYWGQINMDGSELALHFSSNTAVNVSFDGTDSMNIETILRVIADPTTLSALLPSEHKTIT